MERASRRLIGFGRFAMAFAVGPALTLAAVTLAARTIQPADFVAFNLALIAASIVSQLGSGHDSASSRLLSRGSISETQSVTWAFSCRFLLLLAAVPLCVAISWASPLGPNPWMLLASALALAAAQSTLALASIRPHALGDAGALLARATAAYVPIVGSVGVVAVLPSPDLAKFLTALTVGAALGCCLTYVLFLSGRIRLSKLGRAAFGTDRYQRLAWAIFASVAVFAATERIDVIIAAQFFPAIDAAQFAGIVRIAMIVGMASSAYQALAISRLSRIPTFDDLKRHHLREWPSFMALAVAALLLATIGGEISAMVLGPLYRVDAALVLLVTAPYVLYAIYSPYALWMATIGYRANLLRITIFATGAKLVAALTAAMTGSLPLLYASGLVGAIVGAVVTYWLRNGGARVASRV